MRNRASKPAAILFAVALLLSPRLAHALAECVVSATPVAFGVYDPLSPSPLNANGTVTVSCSLLLGISLLVAYNIDLSTGSSGVYTPRTLKSGSNIMNYNLFTSNTYTTIWGNTTGGTGRITDGYLLGLANATTNYPVYGRVPATQNIKAGSYTDSIIVTITY